MIISFKGNKPYVKIAFISTEGKPLFQECLLDTGYEGAVLLYAGNQKLIESLRLLTEISASKKDYILGDGSVIRGWETRLVIFTDTVDEYIDADIILGGDSSEVPLIGIEFLKAFNIKMDFDFLKKVYNFIYQ